MWIQVYNPLDSFFYSSIIAFVPIFMMFTLLILKVKGYVAGFLTLVVTFVITNFIWEFPFIMAISSVIYGIIFSLFPIFLILYSTIFLFNLTKASGYFDIIKLSLSQLTTDKRLQLLLIGFCFANFLDATAGFVAPVAIVSAMLVGLGFNPTLAASLALVASSLPAAFGGVGIPLVILSQVTGLPLQDLSIMTGRQIPLISLIFPSWLIVIMGGFKSVKGIEIHILVVSLSFAISQWLISNYFSPFLVATGSSLVSLFALIVVIFLRPIKVPWDFMQEKQGKKCTYRYNNKINTKIIIKSWSPFLILALIILLWNLPHIQYILNTFTFHIPFTTLNHQILKVPPIVPTPTSEEVVFNFNWASSAGTAIFISLLFATPLLKISFCEWKKQAIDSLKQLKWTWFTMATVNGIAFLMNYSGMAVTLGLALAKTGSLFPFLSPAIAWLGTFLVGSNTISNAMFGNLQVATARTMGLSPVLFAATNGSGAVAGKMIAPNQLTAAASSVDLPGHEGELFKHVFKHSILFVIMVGFITWIESYIFTFIIP